MPTAAQTEHPPIVDDRPFRGDREARAAITCWLEDGAEIIRRCRVEKDAGYLRDGLVEFATVALAAFDDYRGIDTDSLADAALRQWVERELAEAEARLARAIGPRKCPSCKREFKNGDTCRMGGCPMGGDF
jgi:hypothetical protein